MSRLSRHPLGSAPIARSCATSAAAVSATSARMKDPTWGCVADGAVSIWTTREAGENSCPKRIVN